ncbi:protocatechuate 3,4-dioxygenase subunit beta [Arthrobacter pigmenti]
MSTETVNLSDRGEGSQDQISGEIQAKHAEYREKLDAGASPSLQPDLDFAPYRSSILRHPTKNPRQVDPEQIELVSPAFGHTDVAELESNLTIAHSGEPLGERMTVQGRLLDGEGRPVRHQLVEVWQANAAGRYIHKRDQHPAPIDPNFTGTGRCITDDEGWYRFLTVKPGAYPWKNHRNAWRPAHIHFSVFGTAFTQRIVTQMYFPGDPLFPLDPIYNSIVDQDARDRLVAKFDHNLTSPEWALGYRWDIVLTGSKATWVEPEGDDE